MPNKVTIDLDKIAELTEKSDEVMLTNEGEKHLVELLQIQEKIDRAVDTAKKKIEEAALDINPNFKSLRSDRIRIYYRQYGARWKIDESLIREVPRGLYEIQKKYKLDNKAVEKYAEENGLPRGIIEPERPHKISISVVEEKK